MRKSILLFILFSFRLLQAQPGAVTEHLKVDQFGYLPDMQKICVVNNPQAGFDYNAGDFYTPGATLQLRDATTNAIVFSGPATSWHSGATYAQSGDKAWWFDFSSVTTTGTYYVYDPTNAKHSFYFDIRVDVYSDVMKHAMRMFYYQRSGFAKTIPFAGDWHDGASHLGTQQDLDCRLVTNPLPSNSKNLKGGWFDAGDYNKYVNFAYEPIHDLMLAYIERPGVWADNYNIPESGNGIPDILDEVKWELDWLRRMQESNGSVLMKVSVTDFSAASPPSADTGFRRYGPAQASSTRTAASMYAIGAIAFQTSGITSLQPYADTLKTAAINAWNWLVANPGFSNYNNSGFVSANPEISTYAQSSAQFGAAVLLYALTGQATYKSYVESNYTQMQPIQWTFWYPWESILQDLLLYYTKLPGITPAVKTAIQNSFINAMTNNSHLLPAYTNTSCAYRAFMNDGDNTWGSNRPRGHTGSIFYNYVQYHLSADTVPYRNAAGGYINFLHGENPISRVMLTNMNDYGAEKSANEMYHSWFADGTNFDNALTSLYGPAPGYQPGGFNPSYQPDPSYSGPPIVPPQSQPSLKSYKDWNTSWPENSWEITETSISNQGSYIKLLSKFIPAVNSCNHIVTSGADQGSGTLRNALSCVNVGDTIRLQLAVNDSIKLTSGTLTLGKNITILNLQSGKAKIYCGYSGVGVLVSPGVTVNLFDLSFRGIGTNMVRNDGVLNLHNVLIHKSGLSAQALTNFQYSTVFGTLDIRN
ncbi:MAG: glycoside hydrolase family 9 protein [Saprospiraceae bacterium]